MCWWMKCMSARCKVGASGEGGRDLLVAARWRFLWGWDGWKCGWWVVWCGVAWVAGLHVLVECDKRAQLRVDCG